MRRLAKASAYLSEGRPMNAGRQHTKGGANELYERGKS